MKHTTKQIVRESKYRQIVVESRGAVDSFKEIHPSDFSSIGETVAASATHVAYCTALDEVQVIPVKDTNKKDVEGRVNLIGHVNGPVLDVAFSTLDYGLLASGGSDGTAKVWRPTETSKVKVNLEVKNVRAVANVRWHPTCASILGAGGASIFSVFDIEAGVNIATFDVKKDLSSASWNWTGSACLLSTPSDKSIRMVDPRTRELSMEIENCYSANKPIVSEWIGSTELFLSSGHSMNRDREVCLWDARSGNSNTPLARMRFDQNSGLLRPLIDSDTKLVFFSGHGDSAVRAYEIDTDALHLIGTFAVPEPAKSSCLLPKAACDIMGCEIDRVLRLCPSGQIEGVRVEVPRRKAYRDFQEDIFPDTKAPQEALTKEAYLQGGNAEPLMTSVKALAAIHSTSEETQERAGREEQEEEDDREERDRLEREEIARLAEKSEELDKRFSKFLGYQAKLKFTRGAQSKKDDSCYNLTPDCGGSDSINLACSERYFAVPWKGSGGPIYVGDINGHKGKMQTPVEAPTLNGHSGTVNCLAFDEFDPSVLASGSDDCSIRIWRIPSFISSSDDANQCLQSSVKLLEHRLAVKGVGFHRLCKDLFYSFSSDNSLKLWDVSSQQCVINVDEPAGIWNVDWSYDGSQLVAAGKDSEVRLIDPRAWKTKVVHHFPSHEGLKGSRVCWLGKEPAIVTTGFSKTGDRQFKLWDNRMFGTDRNRPLSSNVLDNGAGVMLPYFVEDNGALILSAKGELTIRIYEIEGIALAPEFSEIGKQKRQVKKFDLHKCTEFKCVGEPTAGLAFLPRRLVDYKGAEWLHGLRMTPTQVETISFSVPRSAEIQGYFYDDLYPPARSGEPVLTSPVEWSKGATCSGPNLVDMNKDGLKILSQRPAAEAHLAMKRGVASSDRMKKEQEDEAKRKKEQQDALERMQRLAVQHEKYNPNLSKPGVGHHEVSSKAATGMGPSDVKDDEWED